MTSLAEVQALVGRKLSKVFKDPISGKPRIFKGRVAEVVQPVQEALFINENYPFVFTIR